MKARTSIQHKSFCTEKSNFKLKIWEAAHFRSERAVVIGFLHFAPLWRHILVLERLMSSLVAELMLLVADARRLEPLWHDSKVQFHCFYRWCKKTLHVSSNEGEKAFVSLARTSSLSGAQTRARTNIHTSTHQILRTLADASVLRGTVSGSVRERERERGTERKSVRRGEERGMEQFTNENSDYVKPQFCCVKKVRMQTQLWKCKVKRFVFFKRTLCFKLHSVASHVSELSAEWLLLGTNYSAACLIAC